MKVFWKDYPKSLLFPLLVILVGLLWLAQKMGVLTGEIWNYFWPVLVIIIGLKMLSGRISLDKQEKSESKK